MITELNTHLLQKQCITSGFPITYPHNSVYSQFLPLNVSLAFLLYAVPIDFLTVQALRNAEFTQLVRIP